MKRNVVLAGAAILLVIVVGWYFVVYSPVGDDLKSAQATTTAEQAKTQGLEADLHRLTAQKKQSTEQEALLHKFDRAIPEQPDLASFILAANRIATEAGIDFLSIAPSPPAAGGTSSVIALSISVQGSFFQVENYLTRMADLDRLVIIDTLNISAGGGSSSGAAATTDATLLSVSITGRMFTRAAATSAAGTATTPGATTSTTTTPGGSTSTTAPSGSSTTGGT
jgi:type IV pilus assembly protein PilO